MERLRPLVLSMSGPEAVVLSAGAYGAWWALDRHRVKTAPLSSLWDAGIASIWYSFGGIVVGALLGRPLAALVPLACGYSVATMTWSPAPAAVPPAVSPAVSPAVPPAVSPAVPPALEDSTQK